MFERMVDEADDFDDGEQAKSRLIAAWLLLIAAAAAITAWLFYKAEDTRNHSHVPIVRLELPHTVGEITRSDGPPIMAEAPVVAAAPAAPEPQSLPAAPVSPLNVGKLVPRPAKETGPDAPPAPKAAPPRANVASAPLDAPATASVQAPASQQLAAAPAPVVAPVKAPEPAPGPVAAAPVALPVSGDHAALPSDPNPALLAQSPFGQLPVVGPPPPSNGGQASTALGTYSWQYYAKPFADKQNRSRVAIIVTGLGLNSQITEAAISRLPGSVTLAFDPYADHLNDWLARARAQGHEVLIGMPAEPSDYPDSDPGPATLLTSLSASDNLQRLQWVLARATGYVGVVGEYGGRFMSSPKDVLPILDELKRRGLMYVDNLPSSQSRTGRLARDLGLPRAMNDLEIDADPSAKAIEAHFGTILELARSRGQAVAFAQPLPVTIDVLERLLPSLGSRNLVLAPVSAVANRQSDTL